VFEKLFYRHKGLIICGLIGLFFGPIGLIIGLLIGYAIDRGRPMSGNRSTNRLFFETCFLMMGHLAKTDGHVSAKEIQYARRVMTQLHLTAAQIKEAMQLFYRGKRGDFDRLEQLVRFRRAFGHRARMLAQFINFQVRLAYIDGQIDAHKKGVLQDTAQQIGLNRLNFSYYDLMFGWQARFEQARRGEEFSYQTFQSRSPYKNTLSAAYRLLNIKPGVSKHEVKRAYRRMMSKYHPDKLMSKGLSEQEMQKATEKAQAIRQAYEQICASLG
jgi:DnaJ like chaperone protein